MLKSIKFISSKSLKTIKKLNHKKYRNIKHTIIFILFLIIIITSSLMIRSDDKKFDHKIDNWYDIEPWEVEVCSKWGGSETPNSLSGGGFNTKSIINGYETVTLQAKKTNYNQTGNVIYEVSWFYQPGKGSDTYSVHFLKNSKETIIYEASTNAAMGDGNYHAEEFEDDPDYDQVILKYNTSSLTVDISVKEVSN